jgi:predicted RND superfamily exporter protein
LILPPRKSTERFAARIVAARWYLLVLAFGLAAAAWQIKREVQFDHSIEGMFAPDDPQLRDYQRLKQIFGGAEIVLAVYDDPNLLNPDGSGLAILESRSRELARLKGIAGVLSLAEINNALKKLYGLANVLGRDETASPLTDPDDELAQAFLKTFEGYTHGADGRTVSLVCVLEPTETLNIPRERTIRALNRVVRHWNDCSIAGEPVMLVDGFRFVRRDGERLNQICLILMAAVMLICFRSFRWILIPIAVVQWSMWMTLATLKLMGHQLTMVSSMMAAILAVIAVAEIVHFIVRYREARVKLGHSRESAMEFVFASLWWPVLWTCLTTAAGFFALTWADVEPVSDFGLMMTFGSLYVLLGIILLVPGLALLGNLDTDPQETWGEGWLERALAASARVVIRRPVISAIGILAFFGVLSMGAARLRVETDFTKNFRQDSEIIKAYQRIESRLGGAGVLDLVIRAPENLNREFLEKIDAMQLALREIRLSTNPGQPALTHVVSYADADRIARLNPVLAMLTPEIRFRAMSEVMPGFATQMRTTKPDEQGHHYFRITLRTGQRKTSGEQTELISGVRETAARFFPDTPGDAAPATMTTGFFVLLSGLVDSVLQDQSRTFVLACILVGSVLLIAYRSLPMTLIAMIANTLPIAAVMGALGWVGIPMNMGAAMIAAVSMGLAIDGSIHYLSSYRHNRATGCSPATALERVQLRTGRAVTYASLALIVGFGSLCLSEFIPTVFFGALAGLSMLGALFGNLLVVPALLSLWYRAGTSRRSAGGNARRTSGVTADKAERHRPQSKTAHGASQEGGVPGA